MPNIEKIIELGWYQIQETEENKFLVNHGIRNSRAFSLVKLGLWCALRWPEEMES
jgi:hypothetical protein